MTSPQDQKLKTLISNSHLEVREKALLNPIKALQRAYIDPMNALKMFFLASEIK